MRLEQRAEFNARRDSLSYPEIPDATEFQGSKGSFEVPSEVHGWQWSTTFGRWSALCTFPCGWHGFTFPKTWEVGDG